ncbi:unnamed protein product [Mytilus edulis]|uniref:Uncharacterized protein n=1 Tax=Mytilus edulis TaxID=6550 RepID=A0A8S3U3G5_MYTED|nr:unnamed protein product [Mytilus edulis]
MIFLLVCFLLTLLFINYGNCVPENACLNPSNEIYCCNGYEWIDNRCEACRIGYSTPILNITCQPCMHPFFGDKCSGLCPCSETERCNHVNGSCTSTIESTIPSSYLTTETTTDKINIESTSLKSVTSEVQTVTAQVVVSPFDKETGTFSSTNLIIYCLAAACFILILALCYFFNKHRINAKQKQLHVITNPEDVALNDKQQKEEDIEMESDLYMYHVIDESQMIESCDKPKQPNVYLDVVSSSVSDSSDIEDKTKDTNEYLHPYHSLVGKKIPMIMKGNPISTIKQKMDTSIHITHY